MTPGKVTCVLTSYNRPKYLRGAIESVLSQTYQNWELFIMDDNSDIPEVNVIIDDAAFMDNRIKYYNSKISEEERETTGCRYAYLINEAIDKMDGEFITYLTDDDFFLPKRFELMVNYFNAHPEIFVVYGWQEKRKVDEHGNETPDGTRQGGIQNSASCNVDHNSVMHRKVCFDKVGKWNTNDLRCGDAGFWIKLNEAGYLFYPITEITDVKRYHPYTITDKLDRGENPLKGVREP